MTAAIDTDPRTSRRAEARLAKLRIAAFRKARRHTWLVKSMRVVLPSTVVLMMAGYATVLQGNFRLRVGAGTLGVQKVEITTEDLKMKGVDYTGVTKDGGRYVVHARDAQVDIRQKGPVTLNIIDGNLVQLNGVTTRLTSKRGVLDNAKGEMDLFDGVTVDASNGLKARMKSAKVFNKENRIVAQEGVVADTATGRIAAQAMELQTKERKGVFTGNVAVRMTPDPASTKSPLGEGGKDAKLPLDMTAQRLDFDDTAKLAVFTGGVTAVQGESQLTANALRVTYEGRADVPGVSGAKPVLVPSAVQAEQAKAPPTRVSKLVASGQLTITQGPDRRVIAETMDADVAADTVVFTGPNVEVQQGRNRLLGRRLDVDRKAGKSRLSSPAEGRTPAGRIKTTFVQEQKPGAVKGPVKAAVPAVAQAAAAGGLMTFKTDASAPMDIEADTLDVDDTAKQAIFRKSVRAQQGDFVINASEVVATYSGETGLMTKSEGEPAKGAGAQIARIEANENVVITSKEGQEARGKKAVFEQKANTVVLTGDVLVKQGRTEIRGNRLRIDMTTGVAVFEREHTVAGGSSVGVPLAPIHQPKSAPGPGGLPEVGGVVVPQGPQPAGPGRQSIVLYPEDHKKDGKGLGKAVPKATPKAAPEEWKSTTSPSPVYRAPTKE